jgi:hypothetical protein
MIVHFVISSSDIIMLYCKKYTIYLFIYLFILFIYLFIIYLFIYLFSYLFIYLFIYQEGIPTEGKDPAWRCTYTLGKIGLLIVYGNQPFQEKNKLIEHKCTAISRRIFLIHMKKNLPSDIDTFF